MASREELIRSIRPDMMLNKAFFLKVYGYAITQPGFADTAIGMLENAGCSRAREYYDKTVSEYKRKQDKELEKVAAWYRKECEKEWKRRGEEKRKQEQENLQQMSDGDLIMLLESLIGVS